MCEQFATLMICEMLKVTLTAKVCFAAVFDGHGGDAAAEWLHENMPDFVESAIKQSKNFSAGLRAAFQVADGELLSHLGSASSDGKLLTGAGATATVLLVDLKHVVAANVGDSTAILMRYGQQITLTSAHRVYGPCAPTLAATCLSSGYTRACSTCLLSASRVVCVSQRAVTLL